jgi:hypothetical protein
LSLPIPYHLTHPPPHPPPEPPAVLIDENNKDASKRRLSKRSDMTFIELRSHTALQAAKDKELEGEGEVKSERSKNKEQKLPTKVAEELIQKVRERKRKAEEEGEAERAERREKRARMGRRA